MRVPVFVCAERSRLDKARQIESGVFIKTTPVGSIHYLIYIYISSFSRLRIIFYLLPKLSISEASYKAKYLKPPNSVQLCCRFQPMWDHSDSVSINDIKHKRLYAPECNLEVQRMLVNTAVKCLGFCGSRWEPYCKSEVACYDNYLDYIAVNTESGKAMT